MGDFQVNQRTKDSMFNATELAKQWNRTVKRGRKDVSNFLDNKNTKEFIEALADDLNSDTRNLVSIVRGKNQGTWMHPYLFIKFSMWLNPKFEVKVIKFVYDELIQQRHLAGDNYRMLSESGVKLKGYNFSEVATAMNWIIFNKRGKNLRQSATQEQLREMSELESKLSFAIDMGYIKDYKSLIEEMKLIWKRKYRQTPF